MDDAAWVDDDVIDLTVELIRNACVNTGDVSSGNEITSVRTLQRYLDLEGIVVEPAPGRASVVFRVEGRDPDAPRLLMIPHTDVVPASEGEWTFPPFDGTRADGFVWGRGAVDMLNVTASMAAVFRALVRGDLPQPAGDLILAAVADEEAGGVHGAAHLAEHHWDLVGCDYVLTEVACPTLPGDGDPALPVTVAEKGPAWHTVRATGVAGHGSQPYGRPNALLTLSRAVDLIGVEPQPVLITEEWLRFVPFLPVPADLRERLAAPDTVDAAIDELAETDPTLARWVHACTHLTFSPNLFTGGTKVNVVPDRASAEVDVRLLPGQDLPDIADHLRKILGPGLFDELDLEPIRPMVANGSPTTGPLWEAIGDAALDHLGTGRLAPTMTPVTTDARFFRRRGVPAYGVGLFDDSVTLPEMLGMFHGADERVSERSILHTTAFLGSVLTHFSERVA